MKDLIRAANRIAAYLPESMTEEWAIIFHDTATYKAMSEEEKLEAQQHLTDLLAAKMGDV